MSVVVLSRADVAGPSSSDEVAPERLSFDGHGFVVTALPLRPEHHALVRGERFLFGAPGVAYHARGITHFVDTSSATP